LDHVRMPAGKAKMSEKTKGRYLEVLSATKRSIFKMKAAVLCFAHAFIINLAKLNGDTKYKLYRDGKYLMQIFQDLLSATVFNSTNCKGLKIFNSLKIIFRTTKL